MKKISTREVDLVVFSLNGREFKMPPIAKQLVEAVAGEIKSDFVARSKVNKISPSFPYNHRTCANRDALKTGVKEKILVGNNILYKTTSLLEMLCEDLSKGGSSHE
ncbi:MAG: hypothetical protein ABRQ33_00890 [Smithellaceae bacterium]